MNAAIGASGDAPADTRPDESAAPDDSWSVRLLGLGLLLAALGAGIGLLAAGAALPPLVPLLGLAAIAGLCVNCEVFFPSELASTAESAAIFAAIVGMQATSPWLGPLAVALAVGPLDILHWRQRAYFRMAYNSGSQGLAALTGAAIFGLVDASVGTGYAVACALVAAVPYALVDSTLGFWLMRIRGESVRTAARHQWSLNAVAFPLAAIGAAAGVLAREQSWWLAVLVLLPVPWVPELLLVRMPAWCRRQPRVRLRALVTVTALLVTAVAAVAGSAAPLTLAALLVFAVLLGVDLRVDSARVVPPLVGIVVIAAAVVHDGNVWVAAPLVAVAATVVAWRARVPARALVVGIVAGGVCAGFARVFTTRAGSLSAVLVAIAAAGSFAMVAIAFGARGHARATSLPRLAWSVPLFLVAALLAEAWAALGISGAVVFGAGVALAVVEVGWWGAAPWGSRGLARRRLRSCLHNTRWFAERGLGGYRGGGFIRDGGSHGSRPAPRTGPRHRRRHRDCRCGRVGGGAPVVLRPAPPDVVGRRRRRRRRAGGRRVSAAGADRAEHVDCGGRGPGGVPGVRRVAVRPRAGSWRRRPDGGPGVRGHRARARGPRRRAADGAVNRGGATPRVAESGVGTLPAPGWPRAERVFCFSLAAGALVIGTTLVAAGASGPPLVAVLAFALVVGLSVNRGALFSTELSFTADAAVLLAAVVAFRSDAPLLGPFAVAALTGPLDALHWRQRSFSRMAYNAGSQALGVLPAAAAFGAVRSVESGSLGMALMAGLLASLVYVVLDSAFASVLVVLRGDVSPRRAPRVVLAMNRFALLFALVGALVGAIAVEAGWWVVPAVLLPLSFAPEVVVGRPARWAPFATGVLVAAILTFGVLAGVFTPSIAIGLGVLAVLAGIEFDVKRRALVPPLTSLLVVAALATTIAHGHSAAVIVAVVVTLVSWTVRAIERGSARSELELVVLALVVAATAAVATIAIVDTLSPGRDTSVAVLGVIVLAGVGFEVVAALAGSRTRIVELSRAMWALPVLALAAALALVWRQLGVAGAAVFALGTFATLSAVAWWGAPPWTSRVLGMAGRRGPRTGRQLVLIAVAATAMAAAVAALIVVDDARDTLVLAAFAALQADVALALVGVRQWRFAPIRRVWSAGALLAASALGFAYAAPGFRGDAWGLLLLVVALGVPTILGWPLGILSDRAYPQPPEDPGPDRETGPRAQRMPDSRNASR
jgi:hypothetical protein